MPSARGESSNLYIPFLDGRIGYDCRACGSKCCRLGYLIMTDRERDAIVRRHPRLTLFYGTERGGCRAYLKLDPRCWFLSPQGMCGIEETMGREAKPLGCRAHPIYFAHYGDLTVTALAPGCHWTLDEKPEIGALLTWRDVESFDLESRPHFEPGVPPAPWTASLLADVLAGEPSIRDAAPEQTSVKEYLAWQLAFSAELLQHRRVPSSLPEGALDQARAYMDALEQVMATVLGVAPESIPASAALDRVFLDFGGVLRLSVLGLTPQYGEAAPKLRSPRSLYAGAAPLLMALYVYARIGDHLGVPGAASSYNVLHQMLVHGRDRLFACSRMLHPLAPSAAQEIDRDAPPGRTSLGVLVGRSPGTRLAEHLLEASHGQPPEVLMSRIDSAGRALANAGEAGPAILSRLTP
jgi:Fe-S-cluster containining protein